MDFKTATSCVKYLFVKFNKPLPEETLKVYTDYLITLDFERYCKARYDLLQKEKDLPSLSTIGKYYLLADDKKTKESSFKPKIECVWCDGKGGVFVVQGDYETFYRCNQCTAWTGTDKIPSLDVIFDVHEYNKQAKKGEIMSIFKLQEQAKEVSNGGKTYKFTGDNND